jgi:uncharacterized membrane protein
MMGLWGMGLLGGLGMLLFWALIIGLVAWLVVTLSRLSQSREAAGSTQPDSVLETLRRRLANGDITPQEFDELRQKLSV